jgi:galactofuranosylgalactofuranosylrhamnosyl-N-acetylglucosaminyl-diphospho-decaprenol beta-1,5/1,6-galactofuranosyltransferase
MNPVVTSAVSTQSFDASQPESLQTTLKLQSIVFPKPDVCTEDALFFRANSQCWFDQEQSWLDMQKGGVVVFDTYFNALSVQKWKQHTHLDGVDIKLSLKGRFNVTLLNLDCIGGSPKLIAQGVIDVPKLEEVGVFKDIEIQGLKGLLYLKIEALEDDSCLVGGYFQTRSADCQMTDKRIAIVFCTFKRETFIKKNVALLEKYLLNTPKYSDKFSVFVIDNGRTLEEFDHPQVHLIPNKNTGGSGGFTRGIIEVLKRRTEYSHIVFMDDDVIIEPEVLARIHSFQSIARNPLLCLGGAMLRFDKRYLQHENGAIWDQGIVALKANLDLRPVENLLINEVEELVDFNAWWLFCFPLQAVDVDKLPYPFFIKMDDIEFSLRLNLDIITLNGICVWHEEFEAKSSPGIEYYYKKHDLIVNTVYEENFSAIAVIKQTIKFSLREAFCYRYQSANLYLQSTLDFLKGPDVLVEGEPDQRHREVLKMGEKATPSPSLPFIFQKYHYSIQEKESTLHRVFRVLLLNGHLLPAFLFKSDEKLMQQGYRVIPIQGYRPINVFRAKKALYYNLSREEGFVVQFSRLEFFKILLRTILVIFQVLLQFPKVKQRYRESLPELTHQKFWERYLGIKPE